MRVLVTGGAGFVGRHVLSYLLDETDWEVALIDHRYVDLHDNGRSHFIPANLDQPWDWRLDEAIGEVDVVFHLAAASDVRRSLDRPVQHVHTNVDLTLNLLEWARRRGDRLSHVVQVSTNEVYGPSPPGMSHEWDSIVPVTPYSASKAAQEALSIAWWRSYSVPTVIVNTQHIFGEGQPSSRFIPTVVDRLLEGRHIEIIGEVGDAPVRRWLYARDLADALRWVVDRGRPASPTEQYPDRWHIAGDTLNCLQVAKLVANLIGKQLDVKWIGPGRVGYEKTYVLDVKKSVDAGWRPLVGFYPGLERTVEWAVDTHDLRSDREAS